MSKVINIQDHIELEKQKKLEEDHKRRVAAFPEDVRSAHAHSASHRGEVMASHRCGCFYCCSTFAPQQIEEWVDEVDGQGQTALCPMCGVDSVIGDHSGLTLSPAFLSRMRAYWFS